MGWQRGRDDDQGAGPVRDPRLPGFAKDGEWDTCPPSAALTAVLEEVSGPEWRCPGATRDEMLGMLAQAQALESRAAAVKLGILRSLVRDDDAPCLGAATTATCPKAGPSPSPTRSPWPCPCLPFPPTR